MSISRVGWFAGIITLTIVAVFLRAPVAHAAGVSLTTSPVLLNLVVHPGASTTQTLQMMNNGSQPVKIDMKLDVFSADGNTGEPRITEPLPGDLSTEWVSFSPSSFIAQPGVWSKVQMTIGLPKDASLGYYYAVIFKPDVPDESTGKGNLFHGSNAILVLVDTQSGNEQKLIDINNFSVSAGLYEYLPATFSVSIHNGGNIYFAPVGTLYIGGNKDMTSSIAAININPNGGNILPQSSRDFQIQWNDGFPLFKPKEVNGQIVKDKNGNPVTELSWNFAKFNKIRFGHYYAKVTLVYSNGLRVIPITRVVSFWVIPWKLILFTVAVLTVLIVGLANIGRFAFHMGKRARIYRR